MSEKLKTVVVIPCRMGSSRFKGKPLYPILGLPMIEHVRRRALLAENVDDVIVATCDKEIFESIESFGGNVVMTSKDHERCTDRVEEAISKVDCDIVVNLQGDEPLITPGILEDLIQPLLERPELEATNIVHAIKNPKELESPHVVKVVLSNTAKIIYLSRSVIPGCMSDISIEFYKQTGIMGFRKEFLRKFTHEFEPGPLEKRESVDMVRIMENDGQLQGVITEQETRGVDLLSHISEVEEIINTDPLQKELHDKIVQK